MKLKEFGRLGRASKILLCRSATVLYINIELVYTLRILNLFEGQDNKLFIILDGTMVQSNNRSENRKIGQYINLGRLIF